MTEKRAEVKLVDMSSVLSHDEVYCYLVEGITNYKKLNCGDVIRGDEVEDLEDHANVDVSIRLPLDSDMKYVMKMYA